MNKILTLVFRIFSWRSIVLFFFLLSAEFIKAQTQPSPEYQVKAVFLFNFTRFIDWPPETFSSPDDPFIIGIIGEDPFGSYLDETVSGEKIGTHPIRVQRFQNIKDITGCQILYINSYEPEEAKQILSVVSGKNILTVSDATAFNKWGGTVRFFTENDKIKLQINVEASKEANLNISSKLLSVAQIY